MSDRTDAPDPVEPMRADARRNRRLLLDAAIELVLQIGGEPSRDAIAHRAGVGIATLYRHFPDRQSLLRAVVLDVLDRTIERGQAARSGTRDGGEALREYLHGAIDTGLGAVNILHPLVDEPHWPERQAVAQDLLEFLVTTARNDGAISSDVTATDVALASIRFSRPLSIGLDTAQERAVAHRQLDTYLDGLLLADRRR